MDQHYVTALFQDPETAKAGVERLLDASFRADEISVVVADETGRRAAPVRHETGITPGALAGGALGGVLGALGAALVSVGTLPVVGLGLAAAGPLSAAASGAVGGAAGGGLVGVIGGLGFWKEVPDLPEDLENGAVLVSVPVTEARSEDARKALSEAGAKWLNG
jgi:hypothetical protein